MRSRVFWIAAICLAAIPLLVMDIPKHYIDWNKEVHDEMIITVHNEYNISRAEKANRLDAILEANKTLMAKMYIKSFVGLLLLALSLYLFAQYKKQNGSLLKATGISLGLVVLSVGIKLYMWMGFSGDENIKLLTLSPADTSLTAIYANHFKGKVVYVDFWGTTCGPCLEEFRSFNKPLKQSLAGNKDVAYLYICGGSQMLWKQQIQKFDVAGSHLFLNAADYRHYFKEAIKGDKDTLVAMPRYLIMDKTGKIVNTNAARPSNKAQVMAALTKLSTLNPTPAKL